MPLYVTTGDIPRDQVSGRECNCSAAVARERARAGDHGRLGLSQRTLARGLVPELAHVRTRSSVGQDRQGAPGNRAGALTANVTAASNCCSLRWSLLRANSEVREDL